MQPTTGYRRRWGVLGVLVIVLLIVVIDNTILNVALRVISDPEQGLGATQSQLAWAINSYTLVFAGLLFTWGVVGDRLGRKRVLIGGLVLFGLGSLISAYSQSPDQLIWARALMGFGGAAVMPQTLSIITNVFPPEERGRAISIWAGAVGLALGIGPPLGGLLLMHFWWGSVFLINVPIVLIGVLFIVLLVPESRNPSPGRLDPVGVALSIIGMVLLVYGIIGIGDRGGALHPDTSGAFVAGLALLAVFVLYESRIEHPALNVRLFRNPRLAVSIAVIMLVFFAMAGVMFFINFYLQSVREYSPLYAGLLIIPIAVAQLIFAPLSNHMVARWGPKLVGAAGLILVASALGSYSLCDEHTPIALLCVIFFVQGMGMAITMTPATVSIMAAVPPHQAGVASAVQNSARQVAVALGVAVLGSLLSLVYRSRISPSLEALPEEARRTAAASIEETLAVAGELGPQGAALVEPAKQAFLAGMHVAALCSLTIALVGAATVLIWLPRHAERPAPSAPAAPSASDPSQAAPRRGEGGALTRESVDNDGDPEAPETAGRPRPLTE